MDSSTSSVQDVQNQKTSDQPVASQQQPAGASTSQDQKQQQKTTQQISVGKEAESGYSVSESPDENDEEEIQVAPQENKANVGQQQGGGSAVEAQEIEVSPTIPEVKIEKSLEGVVEASVDKEEPKIEKKLEEDAGLTLVGPGVIDPKPMKLVEDKLPAITYEQAALEEKKTPFKSSKHWVLGLVMFVLRKLKEKNREGVTV